MKYLIFIISLMILASCSMDSSHNKQEISTSVMAISFSGESNHLPIEFQLDWTPRTLSGVNYIFWVWNPKETDKTTQELREFYLLCQKEWVIECNNIPPYESLSSTYDSGMNLIYTGNIARMTPEIEYLVYTFLSDSLIRESSIKCAWSFWKDDREWAPLYNTGWVYEDMWEVIPENWWNPYKIDINKLIVVNSITGRKEFNMYPIWTLRTQILFPSVWSGIINGHYTNLKLTECLDKNHLLIPLQSHINYYYDRFFRVWIGKNPNN